MFESHFQSSAAKSDPSQSKARVALLRDEFEWHGLDGFIVPRSDERNQPETGLWCAN